MTKTYEESMKIWFIRNYGADPFNYRTTSGIVKSTIAEVIDSSKPIDITVDYDEGYHYSEGTYADASVEVIVHYYTKEQYGTFGTAQRHTISYNEQLNMGDIIKEVLEISQEGDQAEKKVLGDQAQKRVL